MNLPSLRHLLIQGSLVNLAFWLLDAAWISALPYIDVSFGRASSTFLIFFFLRSGILGLWLAARIVLSAGGAPVLSIRFPAALAAVEAALTLLALYGFMVEPFQLTVTRIEIPVAGLERPVRIVQLSDIHVERTTRREAAIPEVVESLQPDLIVLTGDYLNESYLTDELAVQDLRALIKKLHAPQGIFAVNGNVEGLWRLSDWFKDLDVRILKDEMVRLPALGKRLALAGLSYYERRDNDQALVRLMAQKQTGEFLILLYHKPDIAYTAQEQDVDLYLAGHTHGGQVRLPWYGAVFTNSKYGKRFEMGLYHLGGTSLFVSRGLGFTGGPAPRIRFLAPPEVVLITLVPAGE